MALIVGLGAPAAMAAEPINCGPAPTAACLSAAVFALAKTLPDNSYLRERAGFAERELARGDLKTALEYVVDDNPDPSPWEDIRWIAQAGRFDRAIELAKQRTPPVERLGGLLTVAVYMLDKNDRAGATKIVDAAEPELPSIKPDDDSLYGPIVPDIAAKIRARLGQIDRAARLIGHEGIASVRMLLEIAAEYPAAAVLREQAWREAERVNELWVWRAVLEDAISRDDRANVLRAAQRAADSAGIDRDDDGDAVVSLAQVLLKAELPDVAAKLVKPWMRWVKGKEGSTQRNKINALIPVLVGLALDQDVQLAANAMSDVLDRSQCLSKAAEEYARIGRNEVARRVDIEALRLAAVSRSEDPNQQASRDSALNNLALARAGHGDIQGALDVIAKMHNEREGRQATFYVVRRAIDSGNGPVAGPAIQAMEQQASAARDVDFMLQAANYWYEAGEEEEARRSLAQAIKMTGEGQSKFTDSERGVAAELTWRISGEGKAQALLDIVDRLQVDDPFAIDRLVDILSPLSPALAVQLTGRQIEPERRVTELATIGIRIAEAAKGVSAKGDGRPAR